MPKPKVKPVIDPDNISNNMLKGCIQEIQAIHGYHKSISYSTIKKDLKDIYGYEVPLERIEEYYEPSTRNLGSDTYQQFKNLGLRVGQ